MPKIDELLKKPEVKKIVAIVIIALLAIQALRFAKSLWDKSSSLSAQIKKNTEEINRGTVLPSANTSLNKEIKKLEAEIETAQEKFFTSSEEVFTELNKIAQSTQISLRSITPSEKRKITIPNVTSTYFEIFSIDLKLNCDYNQLLSFLKKIGDFPKFINADKLTIQSNSQDVWNHSMDLELKVPLIVTSKTDE